MARIGISTYRMILDLQDSVSKYEMHVKAGDIGTRKIEATICDGGMPFEMTSMVTATLYVNMGESLGQYSATVGTDGRVTIVLPTALMAEEAEYNCEFELQADTGGANVVLITTPSFKIIVDETV